MATIYYYSSTGNSLHVARSIGQHLNAQVLPMQETVCHDDIIGFVYPAYFWGLPRSTEDFLQNLEIKNKNAYLFSITTFGGIIAGVSGRVAQILLEKNLTLHYCNKIKCVENYIPSYKVNDNDSTDQKTNEQITAIAHALKSGQKKKSGRYGPLNLFIHHLYPKADSDTLMEVNDNCISCGICQRVCPADNIRMNGGKPLFEHHCDHCLGCIHQCPKQAINWNHKTEGKPRYRHRRVALKELEVFTNKS